MINTNQFKNGMTIIIKGKLNEIIEFQHVKPGKGGAFVRTRLKNLNTGAVVDKKFRAGEKFELAHMEHKKLQYLYNDGSSYHFMDSKTYEQIPLNTNQVGKAADYIVEGTEIDASFNKGNLIKIKPPIAVNLKVVEAEPGI
ncbi:MAG: elongation factor P, partial [Actinobacteria bacterium]